MIHHVRQSLRKSMAALAVASVLLPASALAQTLEQAVAYTLDTHPEIRQAFNRFKSREEQVNQAFTGYLPKVDLTAGYGWEQTDSPSTRRQAQTSNDDDKIDLDRRELGISLKQILFDGFFTSSEVSRFRNEASSEQWTLFSTAENTALEVAKVYLNYMQAQEVVKLSEKNLANHQEIYERIKEKTESGLGSTADLSQIKGRLARAKSNLVSAKNNLFDTRSQYQKVVNRAPDDMILPVPDAVMIPANLDEALKWAQENHPTLKATNSDIQAAKYERKSAKSNYYPQVSLELSGNWDENVDGVDGSGITSDVGGESNELQAMVRLRYNLFSGGKDQARDREASYKLGEATELRQRAYRDIVEGTTLAWNARTFVNEQKRYLREHVIAAKETQQSYAQQFKIGQRTLLDLLDSENELFEARKDYLSAEFDEITAQYRILNATGQLLGALRVTTPDTWLGEEQYEGGVRQ
ncbi:TolC family outer membrane protein [Photobacterium lipolyticum]|uniref:Channel protein TolC n=1 Tax=Photobacterium lipolyticum TaxID=266810 RepID=A0A2T3MW22_9GAMM|nr:TolC family outer membrane protein [Photobacterium lipolyticum]PSW04140.1 channel protein TolC [Photobacterium lipolyticum]